MENKLINKALFELKKEIGKMTKDSTNPFFKSKYFDINQLLEHVEPLAAKNGLLILQPILDGKVITEITHVDSGEKKTSELILSNIQDPQKVGSEITYFRRYTLSSLLGIQAEDDDGNKASNPTTQTSKENITWLTEEQFKKALSSNKAGIEATLNTFNTSAKKMKKEYKEQLENKLKQL